MGIVVGAVRCGVVRRCLCLCYGATATTNRVRRKIALGRNSLTKYAGALTSSSLHAVYWDQLKNFVMSWKKIRLLGGAALIAYLFLRFVWEWETSSICAFFVFCALAPYAWRAGLENPDLDDNVILNRTCKSCLKSMPWMAKRCPHCTSWQ